MPWHRETTDVARSGCSQCNLIRRWEKVQSTKLTPWPGCTAASIRAGPYRGSTLRRREIPGIPVSRVSADSKVSRAKVDFRPRTTNPATFQAATPRLRFYEAPIPPTACPRSPGIEPCFTARCKTAREIHPSLLRPLLRPLRVTRVHRCTHKVDGVLSFWDPSFRRW